MYDKDKELSVSKNKDEEVVILEDASDSEDKDEVVILYDASNLKNKDGVVAMLEEASESKNKDGVVAMLEEASESKNKDGVVAMLEEASESKNKDEEVEVRDAIEVVYLSSDESESDNTHKKGKAVARHFRSSSSNRRHFRSSSSNRRHFRSSSSNRRHFPSSSSNSSVSGSSFFRKSLSEEPPHKERCKEGTNVRYEILGKSPNKKNRNRLGGYASNLNKSRKRLRSSSSSSSQSNSSFFRKSVTIEWPQENKRKVETRVQKKNDISHKKRKQIKKHASNLGKSYKKYNSSSSDSSLSDSSLERNILKKHASKERSLRNRHKEATAASYERSYREEVTNEPKEDKKDSLLDFYCRDCQLNLNCELTYKSHLAGRRHFKAIKAHHLHEIAKGSIEIPANPPFVSLAKPRFEEPAVGRRRVRVSKTAKLQRTVDNETRHPMPGLNHLLEISHEKEISYYCQLCDAPCDPTTVMWHLIGSRHQMTCLRYIDKAYYKRIKRDETLFSKKELIRILFRDQGIHGKQRIKVYKEVEDKSGKLNPIDELYFDRPGPSWGTTNYAMKSEHGETSEPVTSHDKYLDTSKGDLRCTLCNSHMNNLTMWASHVRGQRHLKNALKIPGESISKVRSIKASADVVSELKGLLWKKERHSVVVGLDYIRETQGPNGIMYNCFLCGAGSTSLDIVDHILLTKHRIKYLEKLQIDGEDNAIALIKQLDIGLSARDSLVKAECVKMQEKFGKGTVEVYISKDMYRFSV